MSAKSQKAVVAGMGMLWGKTLLHPPKFFALKTFALSVCLYPKLFAKIGKRRCVWKAIGVERILRFTLILSVVLMCRNRRVMLHLTLAELFGLKETFWKTAFLGYNVPIPAFKNTSWIKVCLVSISITIVQTGTVKISLQAYHFCCSIFQRKCRRKGGTLKAGMIER